MLKRNEHEDSRVAVISKTSTRTSMDFQLEAMVHVNDLYQTALHVCPASTRVESMVQETYRRASIGFDNCGPRSQSKRSRFQILFSVVRLEWQAHLKRAFESADAPAQAEPAGFADVPGPNNVASALGRLPVESREVLLLVDCQEFPYQEAGEILGRSPEAVARQIVIARNHLHSQLDVCCSTLAEAAH